MEESVIQKLCSKAKLDRDKGFQDLQEYLKSADQDGVRAFEKKLSTILSDSSSEWESKHGALMGSKAVCQTQICSDEFTSYLVEQALMLADDSEFRVRIAAGAWWVQNYCRKLSIEWQPDMLIGTKIVGHLQKNSTGHATQIFGKKS